MRVFPLVEAAGTPYEMGRRHGRQAAARIASFVEYVIAAARPAGHAASPGEARRATLAAARRFVPLFERHCPRLLEEVRGLADGSGLSFEEALIPQIRGELAPGPGSDRHAGACTTFAVAARHAAAGPLIGQTSDMEPEARQHFILLRLVPNDGPRLLMWTFAGQLGYHGVSEWGTAHFANALPGGPRGACGGPPGLPHYPVKRRLYECRSRAEVLTMWRALPVCSSGNYMIAAGGSLFDVEATPAGAELIEDGGAGFLVHTNHFLHPRLRTAETDAAATADSFARRERMARRLRERLGSLDVAAMKEILADHSGHPCGICRHEEAGERRMATVAGLIAEPAAGRLHVSFGNPCAGQWATYAV